MDRATLTEWIRAHQAELYRYLRYLGASNDVAEDLVQETFLAALDSPSPPLREPAQAVAAWLRGIGRNLFLTHCRQRKRIPVTVSSRLVDEAEDHWASEFLREGDGFDYVEALRRCVAALNGRKRRALELRYTLNQSRVEMAQSLRMTPNGVRSLLQRVRSALADCVRRRLAAEEL